MTTKRLAALLLVVLLAASVLWAVTVDVSIGASADDAFEGSTGSTNITSTAGNIDDANEWIGFRFTGITITAGATIDVAYITFDVESSTLDEPQITIYGEDTASPAQYTDMPVGNTDISERTRTTASVNWSSADLGAAGSFNTPSLVTIIQELVDSYTYSSGVMNFVMTSQGLDSARDFSPTQYDHATRTEPALHIEYTEAGGARRRVVVTSN